MELLYFWIPFVVAIVSVLIGYAIGKRKLSKEVSGELLFYEENGTVIFAMAISSDDAKSIKNGDIVKLVAKSA